MAGSKKRSSQTAEPPKKQTRRIDKLVDANEAGGKDSDKCTLILTVGEVATTFATTGISNVHRDLYGLYSLKRKDSLNPMKLSMNNPVIQHFMQILGLEEGKEYDSETVKSLRYGNLLIIAHEDYDHYGAHIKGLFINLIHTFWPSLLKIVPSFLAEFVLPVVEATNPQNGTVLAFYSMPEFESWRESLNLGSSSRWTVRYYDGLVSSTDRETRKYFRDLEAHKRYLVWEDEEDGEAIKLAFSESEEDRKEWVRGRFEPGTCLDRKEKQIKVRDFVNKDLILYPISKHQTMIPSMVDGLTPCQRKILFNILKLDTELMVRGLILAYHGDMKRLENNIVGMAQDFVGSNNINLLELDSRFGSRRDGGHRLHVGEWENTRLSPITRYLFLKDDDVFLDYLKEEGKSIEPTWYMPVIPTVLVNGSQGICTEFSTSIPKYNPRDIIANIRRLLNGNPMEPMVPWYKGFRGIIEKSATRKGSYTCSGIIEAINETTLLITELPVRIWTDDYVEWLDTKEIRCQDAVEPFIKDVYDRTTTADVHIEFVLKSEEEMAKVKQEGLLEKFNLTTTISTSNMHLFDSKGAIKRYDSAEEIIQEFYHLRLAFCEKKKKTLIENLELNVLKLDNKARFVREVVEGKILGSCKNRDALVDELRNKGFSPFSREEAAVGSKRVEAAIGGYGYLRPFLGGVEAASGGYGGSGYLMSLLRGLGATRHGYSDEDKEIVVESENGGYDYLLWLHDEGGLNAEKVEKLCAKRDRMIAQVDELRKTTCKSMWIRDLDALDGQLDELDKRRDKQQEET